MNYQYSRTPYAVGGEKSVHRGLCVETGAVVVLKFLKVPYTSDDRARFAHEIRRMTAAKAECGDTLATVSDWNLDVDPPFYVEEFFPDGTLAKKMADIFAQKQVFNVGPALGYVRQILVALVGVHSSGHVHRDVKPANIMYSAADRRLVLNDMGIGRTLTRPTMAQTRAFRGTRGYAAPEQAAGGTLGGVDHRADLYAVGVILHEMLTGKRGGWDAISYSANASARAILDGLLAFAREWRYDDARTAIAAIDSTGLARR